MARLRNRTRDQNDLNLLYALGYAREPKVRKCGNWWENHRGPRINVRYGWQTHNWQPYDVDDWDNDEDSSPPVKEIVVPNHLAECHLAKPMKKRNLHAAVEQEAIEEDESIQPSPLLELPAEMLLRILRLVVANRRAFHVTPAYYGRPLVHPPSVTKVGLSIHQVYRDTVTPDSYEDCKDATSIGILPVALVCQLFQQMAYDILYGENQWVFDIIPSRMVSHIECEDSPGKALVSWSQVRPSPKHKQPLFPLLPGTLPFIKDLTLCVGTTMGHYSCGISAADTRKLTENVAKLFEDIEGYCLRRLTISVGVTEAFHAPKVPRDTIRQLRLLQERENGRWLVIKDSVMPSGVGYDWQRLEEDMSSIITPLLQIRSARNVEICRIMSDGVATKLRKTYPAADCVQVE